MKERVYIAIDLKSFYASVECMQRNLDPLNTNLVVADSEKTSKTICLAVTPSLKRIGVSGRPRLFEVIKQVERENINRKKRIKWKDFKDKSYNEDELNKNPYLELDYIIARPRMAYYVKYSTKIYEVYLKYVSEKDIHVYSIDEVFIDATYYLKANKMTKREFAKAIVKDVYESTGITATAGIGSNLYLCKIAMDIRAKHIKADEDGVRIAELDEMTYRKYMWNHTPITDFWRIGSGYKKRLANLGLYTMGDIAKCSIGKESDFYNEKLLYDTFGINAELLIDHAWGYEPVTMKDIKEYKPDNKSISNGQVLSRPYSFDETKTILKEMIDNLSLSLVKKEIVTNRLSITIRYDVENVDENFKGEYKVDSYGRKVPKKTSGLINLDYLTTSSNHMREKSLKWFEENVDKNMSIRKLSIAALDIVDQSNEEFDRNVQISFYDDIDNLSDQNKNQTENLQKEKRLQKATLEIQEKFGKNSLLKGLNFNEESTHIERNNSIGGHRA